MRPALEWKREADRFRLSGRIDEYADLGPLAEALPQSATLDLSGLTRINSIGVREWMDFVATFGEKVVRLERCAPVFVDQLNTIANFAGSAEVTSVLCEYECEHDSALALVQVDVSAARQGEYATPPSCARCGSVMTAAVENKTFFRFVRYAR